MLKSRILAHCKTWLSASELSLVSIEPPHLCSLSAALASDARLCFLWHTSAATRPSRAALAIALQRSAKHAHAGAKSERLRSIERSMALDPKRSARGRRGSVSAEVPPRRLRISALLCTSSPHSAWQMFYQTACSGVHDIYCRSSSSDLFCSQHPACRCDTQVCSRGICL